VEEMTQTREQRNKKARDKRESEKLGRRLRHMIVIMNRHGILNWPKCKCGEESIPHWDDYFKPDMVKWMCFDCYDKRHHEICPMCEKLILKKKVKYREKLTVKGVKISYQAESFQCPECKEKWDTKEMLGENLKAGKRALSIELKKIKDSLK
jgi:hypothetical protein